MGRLQKNTGRAKLMSLALSGAALAMGTLPQAVQAQVAPVINCQGRPVTEMSYANPVLESGTNLQVGAIYRFSDVATNVDALVEITAFVNGGSLLSIDNNIGLANYFQPQLVKTTAESAVDFNFWYEDATTGLPIEMDFAASVIDVDGNSINIREYAEFSDNSVAYVLNNPTELDRNASGPTPGRNRYEARTFTVAPGIDPTAAQNIATVFYTDTMSFDYRIGALGTGSQTRFTSLGFNCPNLQTHVIETEIDEDFGDALVNDYGNPIHTIVSGVQLGATNTAETSSGNSSVANSDNGDDGVSLSTFLRGSNVSVSVDVSGTGGYLQAWVDWNSDGDILDAGEQVAVNVQDTNNDGTIPLDIPVPATATLGNTIARFRWSTVIDVDYQEPAEDGEVEDYQVFISETPPPGLTCPAGTVAITQSGNAGTVITAAQNSTLALGAISTEGTNANGVSARIANGGDTTLTLQLEDIVPGGASVTVSIARDNNGGNTDIDAALTEAGLSQVSSFSAGPNDDLQHITITAPAGGMEFIRFRRQGGRVWIDGVEYAQACVPGANLQASKSVAVFDPNNEGLYALPGNDVIYTITATNEGTGAADTDSMELIDTLPPEIEIWNGDIDDAGPETNPVAFSQTGGAGLTFNYATDVRYSTAATKPADFDACTAFTPDNNYRPDFNFICFNPKGSMAAGDPDPTFSVSFRARIE